jgi:hypothetical protein
VKFGADAQTAAIWPIIVDGLLTAATVELWKTTTTPRRNAKTAAGTVSGEADGGRWAAWLSFLFAVALSLCANIASAPSMNAFAVAVAACPRLALLLAVELLNRALKRRRAELACLASETATGTSETRARSGIETTPSRNEITSRQSEAVEAARLGAPGRSVGRGMTAEQRMWAHYWHERAAGRTPTGAELDRIAGTNNYGRRVMRGW